MTAPTLTLDPSASRSFPSTAWREIIAPDEQELFKNFASRVIAAQQKEVAQESNGPLLRGFHAKLHAGLVGEFQVLDSPATTDKPLAILHSG